jgi:hypothetical protein
VPASFASTIYSRYTPLPALFSFKQDLSDGTDNNLHKASLNLDNGKPLLMLHDAAKEDKFYYALGEMCSKYAFCFYNVLTC